MHTFCTALISDSVRLTSETSQCSGIPSVKSNGSWLPVCENDLTRRNAEVFCRELRCGPPLPDQLPLNGNPREEVWPQNIQCQGNESVLLDCLWLTSAGKECSTPQGVTLTCLGMSTVGVFICLGLFFALPKTVKMVPIASDLALRIVGWTLGVGSPNDSEVQPHCWGLLGQIWRTKF